MSEWGIYTPIGPILQRRDIVLHHKMKYQQPTDRQEAQFLGDLSTTTHFTLGR
jgi:hypothetical protein